MILIFTNKYRPRHVTYFQNENRFKVYSATTRDEARDIAARIKAEGYLIRKVCTDLGTPVAL